MSTIVVDKGFMHVYFYSCVCKLLNSENDLCLFSSNNIYSLIQVISKVGGCHLLPTCLIFSFFFLFKTSIFLCFLIILIFFCFAFIHFFNLVYDFTLQCMKYNTTFVTTSQTHILLCAMKNMKKGYPGNEQDQLPKHNSH